MSYILDALKKAEQERHLEQMGPAPAPPAAAPPPPPGVRIPLSWPVLAVPVALLALGAGYYLLSGREAPTPAAVIPSQPLAQVAPPAPPPMASPAVVPAPVSPQAVTAQAVPQAPVTHLPVSPQAVAQAPVAAPPLAQAPAVAQPLAQRTVAASTPAAAQPMAQAPTAAQPLAAVAPPVAQPPVTPQPLAAVTQPVATVTVAAPPLAQAPAVAQPLAQRTVAASTPAAAQPMAQAPTVAQPLAAVAPPVAQLPMSPQPLAQAPVAAPAPLPTAPPPSRYQQTFSARVSGIKSGCRVLVRAGDTLYPVELADISCLSLNTPIGKSARSHTTRRVFTRTVTVGVLRQEGSDKLIADLTTPDGQLLNRELVARGLANATGKRFAAETQQARDNNLGMWGGLLGGS